MPRASWTDDRAPWTRLEPAESAGDGERCPLSGWRLEVEVAGTRLDFINRPQATQRYEGRDRSAVRRDRSESARCKKRFESRCELVHMRVVYAARTSSYPA
eukprot:3831476-Prymnesium_polylepis.1